MDISGFFASRAGLLATQAFVHSLVASIVAEIAIKAWDVRDPTVRQRVLLIPVVVPVFLVPLLHIAVPGRDSVHFRLASVFETGRWLSLEVMGTHPVRAGLLFVFSITSLVFLFQELVPIVRNVFESATPAGGAGVKDSAEDAAVRAATEDLPAGSPRVLVVEDDEFQIFSTTGRKGTVYVSSSLARTLAPGELRSAVAHEIAHVARSRHPMLVAAYLLRAAMFFNPVALMEFRRAVQEEEKVCDEFAVSLTRDRRSLVETLRKLYLPPEDQAPALGRRTRKTAREIEERSHRLNIESRIARLESGYERAGWGGWLVVAAVMAATVAVNYFVV